jgi:hypothetical protein
VPCAPNEKVKYTVYVQASYLGWLRSNPGNYQRWRPVWWNWLSPCCSETLATGLFGISVLDFTLWQKRLIGYFLFKKKPDGFGKCRLFTFSIHPLLYHFPLSSYQFSLLLYCTCIYQYCALCRQNTLALELLYTNHRHLVRYEKNGIESAFGTKKKHILKNN